MSGKSFFASKILEKPQKSASALDQSHVDRSRALSVDILRALLFFNAFLSFFLFIRVGADFRARGRPRTSRVGRPGEKYLYLYFVFVFVFCILYFDLDLDLYSIGRPGGNILVCILAKKMILLLRIG